MRILICFDTKNKRDIRLKKISTIIYYNLLHRHVWLKKIKIKIKKKITFLETLIELGLRLCHLLNVRSPQPYMDLHKRVEDTYIARVTIGDVLFQNTMIMKWEKDVFLKEKAERKVLRHCQLFTSSYIYDCCDNAHEFLDLTHEVAVTTDQLTIFTSIYSLKVSKFYVFFLFYKNEINY